MRIPLTRNRRLKHKGPQPIAETDIEATPGVRKKLSYIQLFQRDLATMRQLQEDLNQVIPHVAVRHYDMIERFPDLQGIVDRHSNRQRLTQTFTHYFRTLCEIEKVDERFILGRAKIGQVHSRIHLTPEWYLASYVRLYEFLLPFLVSKNAHTPERLEEILQALLKTVTLDMQLIIEAYQDENDFRLVDHVSGITESILGLDGIQEILDAATTASDHAEGIRSAAGELVTSVRKVAHQAVEVAEQANRIGRDVETGRQVIEESFRGILALAQSFTVMQDRAQELSIASSDISHVSEFIRNIANQTNLLAINAAIEAARAGEQGRSFAVVASEVRHLSDQTKQSAQKIAASIEQVQRLSQSMQALTNQWLQELQTRVEQSKAAMETLSRIVGQVASVAQVTQSIAATTEQQSAATEQIATQITRILEDAQHTRKRVTAMGVQIHETGVKANRLRVELIDNLSHLRDKQIIRIAKTEILMWKWRLHNMILGFDWLDENELTDHRQCRLGQWYKAVRQRPSLASKESFRAIEEPHRQLHDLAKRMHPLIVAERTSDATDLWRGLEQAAHQVVDALDRLLVDLDEELLG